MTVNTYTKLGQLTAVISFLIGTIVFVSYYWTSSSLFLFIGYAFVVIALVWNIGVLLSIGLKAKQEPAARNRLLVTCGWMLLNVPVVIVYSWIVIMILGTMRITFTNTTSKKITDIEIIGCGGGHLDELKAQQSATVWVEIIGDCAISIAYTTEGEIRQEVVVSYVTSSMGQWWSHSIGSTGDMDE